MFTEKPPVTYLAPSEVTSPKFALAFAEGCDGDLYDEAKIPTGPFAMFGSPMYIDFVFHARRKKLNFYYGDHAYFGRYVYYRITKNALQHTGEGNATSKRFERLGLKVSPWAKGRGGDILLCPNSSMFYTFWGTTQSDWINQVVKELREHTDRPIKIKQKTDPRPLKEYLKTTWAVVVYTSNCAIDAALVGIPSFATEQCAGSILGSSNLSLIETPLIPDNREQVFYNLADNQWRLDEIRDGAAWRHLNG